ncbi:MAG TPA: acetate kinase [Holophaga sp.]|nr:acetate kinase [Holophaga sp.]
MLILVLNAGSSSLKFNLVDMSEEKTLAEGIAERIGLSEGFIRWTISGEKGRLELDMANHKVALSAIMEQLRDTVLPEGTDVDAVGHRVAHGGPNFGDSEVITPAVLKEIEDLAFYAPLHNPPAASGIRTAQDLFPGVPQVAVFDTSFHHSMPDYAYTYGLPYELCQKLGLRRYGFHGTSHRYVAEKTAALIGKPFDACKIIVCHLGNGSSITAVHNGRSVDTSMGLTPLEGVVMGTRSGNLDPGVITTVMEQEKLDAAGMGALLNKKSGLLGISGVSSDCREVEEAMGKNRRARLAHEVLCYGVLKYIGGYAAAMNGVDAIVFTAGIGENSNDLRAWVCERLTYLGVKLDAEANKVRSKTGRFITTPDSRLPVAVIPTNEELMIAREAKRLTQA